ncbi:leucine Rich repeat-containing domain protein [Dictyocaulus viviparus]|uniref:Leucine Rich repeat-containing domain protein n=1 Tax=Dictyocaulus viviparus TaxID=29172 RepID=A0A0D8XRK3_DICVI|nr:leucine Rich repeat-containing domain protein [Dictyocaulus viviparus]
MIALLSLKSVRVLDLSHNQLQNISFGYGRLDLTTLNLAHNAIKYLPDLSSLQSLRVIDLSNNQIHTVIPNFLPANVESFRLTANNITHLTQWPTLTKLQGCNDATTMMGSVVGVSIKFDQLHRHPHQHRRLHRSHGLLHPHGHHSRREKFFHNYGRSSFPPAGGIFMRDRNKCYLIEGSELDVSFNPLRCDCPLWEFVEWAKNLALFQDDILPCQRPKTLRQSVIFTDQMICGPEINSAQIIERTTISFDVVVLKEFHVSGAHQSRGRARKTTLEWNSRLPHIMDDYPTKLSNSNGDPVVKCNNLEHYHHLPANNYLNGLTESEYSCSEKRKSNQLSYYLDDNQRRITLWRHRIAAMRAPLAQFDNETNIMTVLHTPV